MGEIEPLKETYRKIGDFFKRSAKDIRGISYRKPRSFEKSGIRTDRRIPFLTAPLSAGF